MPPPDPSGPPFPDPVKFDHAAAERVLAELKVAIAQLRTRSGADLRNAANAQDGWTGPFADHFSFTDLPWITRESTRLLDGMLQLQSQLVAAMQHATDLQQQHDLANQRWRDANATRSPARSRT